MVLRMVNPKVMEIRLRSKLKSVLIVHYLKIINDNLNMYINDHLRMYTSDYTLI